MVSDRLLNFYELNLSNIKKMLTFGQQSIIKYLQFARHCTRSGDKWVKKAKLSALMGFFLPLLIRIVVRFK